MILVTTKTHDLYNIYIYIIERFHKRFVSLASAGKLKIIIIPPRDDEVFKSIIIYYIVIKCV